MAERYPIMVLGGYGVFGERICRRLAKDPAIRLIIAGRSSSTAMTLAAMIRAETPNARVSGIAIKVPDNLGAALTAHKPKLVIHCCGPFQGQGYEVPAICIDRAVHYMDLADDRTFVAKFDGLDDAARKRGVLAVSGVSTLPGLSSTVVEHLKPAFSRMRRISIGIAPGNKMPWGLACVEAILSYTGKPVWRWRNSRWTHTHGWQDLIGRSIQGPVIGNLGRRWFAACDVPDQALFPECYPQIESFSFHAGLEVPLLHFGLWAFSWPVRLGLVGSLGPAAPLFHRTAKLFEPWGTNRGGMFLEISGDGLDGAPLSRAWNLIAGAGDGPLIPSIPAVILARKLAHDGIARRGAMPCLNMFTLEDFSTAVGDLDIAFEVVEGV